MNEWVNGPEPRAPASSAGFSLFHSNQEGRGFKHCQGPGPPGISRAGEHSGSLSSCSLGSWQPFPSWQGPSPCPRDLRVSRQPPLHLQPSLHVSARSEQNQPDPFSRLHPLRPVIRTADRMSNGGGLSNALREASGGGERDSPDFRNTVWGRKFTSALRSHQSGDRFRDLPQGVSSLVAALRFDLRRC